MDDVLLTIERFEQRLKTVERDMTELREVQAEIRTMNQTLITLANELKHTNEHLARHERKIEEIDNQPKLRLQQTITAVVSAVIGAVISFFVGRIV